MELHLPSTYLNLKSLFTTAFTKVDGLWSPDSTNYTCHLRVCWYQHCLLPWPLYMSSEDMISDPHICITSGFPMETYLQMIIFSIIRLFLVICVPDIRKATNTVLFALTDYLSLQFPIILFYFWIQNNFSRCKWEVEILLFSLHNPFE